MTREQLVDGALVLLEERRHLICQWGTGVGKSRIAIEFLKRHPNYKCLILVPETNNIDNWKIEFEKFECPMDSVTIACYASFHKFADTRWDLVVYDEAPHLDTELRKETLAHVHGSHILALGALISYDERMLLQERYGTFARSVVTLEDAIKWNILPEPTIMVIHMELDELHRTYWDHGKVYTAKELYDLYDAKVTKLSSAYDKDGKKSAFIKSRMFRAGSQRKRVLGRLKQDAIRDICKYLDGHNKRYLCFCSSIAQAQELGKDHAFTSKTPKSMNLLDKFNSYEIDSLFVVGKLIEGQNVNGIQCGVLGQIGGTDRITIQSIGRVLRSDNPIIYVPVFDNTKDLSYLYTITSNIPKNYIEHYKFNQLQ